MNVLLFIGLNKQMLIGFIIGGLNMCWLSNYLNTDPELLSWKHVQ